MNVKKNVLQKLNFQEIMNKSETTKLLFGLFLLRYVSLKDFLSDLRFASFLEYHTKLLSNRFLNALVWDSHCADSSCLLESIQRNYLNYGVTKLLTVKIM